DRSHLHCTDCFSSLPASDGKHTPSVRGRKAAIRFRDIEASALGRPHRLIAQLRIGNARIPDNAQQLASHLPRNEFFMEYKSRLVRHRFGLLKERPEAG